MISRFKIVSYYASSFIHWAVDSNNHLLLLSLQWKVEVDARWFGVFLCNDFLRMFIRAVICCPYYWDQVYRCWIFGYWYIILSLDVPFLYGLFVSRDFVTWVFVYLSNNIWWWGFLVPCVEDPVVVGWSWSESGLWHTPYPFSIPSLITFTSSCSMKTKGPRIVLHCP